MNVPLKERGDICEMEMGIEHLTTPVTEKEYIEIFLKETNYPDVKADAPKALIDLKTKLQGKTPTANDLLACEWKPGVDTYESYAKKVVKVIQKIETEYPNANQPIAIFTHSTFEKVALVFACLMNTSHESICSVKVPTPSWIHIRIHEDGTFEFIKASTDVLVNQQPPKPFVHEVLMAQ